MIYILEVPFELALEATYNWHWLVDLLEEMGIKVKMCHPKKARAIVCDKIKTDKKSSRMLAHLLRTNLLPESYIASNPFLFSYFTDSD